MKAKFFTLTMVFLLASFSPKAVNMGVCKQQMVFNAACQKGDTACLHLQFAKQIINRLINQCYCTCASDKHQWDDNNLWKRNEEDEHSHIEHHEHKEDEYKFDTPYPQWFLTLCSLIQSFPKSISQIKFPTHYFL